MSRTWAILGERDLKGIAFLYGPFAREYFVPWVGVTAQHQVDQMQVCPSTQIKKI